MITRAEKSNRLFQVAESQQGYFTSSDAKRLGYDYPHQHFHVKQGNWIRVDRGIYRLKKFPTAQHEDLIRWWLWTRKKGVISHDNAADLYDLGDILPAKYHLTVPPDFRKKSPTGVILHKARLLTSDIEQRDGVPVTKPLRIIEDLTLSHTDAERLSAVVKDAVEKGLVTNRDLLNLSSKMAEKKKPIQTMLNIAISEVSERPYFPPPPAKNPAQVKEVAGTWNTKRPSIRELLLELKSGLASLYGERLKGVYLFGSYARGEADRESDLDILVVLQDFNRYAHEVDRTGKLAADLSLKCGVSISLVFLREHEWLRGDSPFLSNVREEAIPA